jgi:phosphoglycerate dehydrogenase-like enzyme
MRLPVIRATNKSHRLVSLTFLAVGILTFGTVTDSAHAQVSVPQASTPIPEGDVNALIKQDGLPESAKTAMEMVPGWTKPKLMIVHIDRPDRLAWLQKAVPDVKLVGVVGGGNLEQNNAEAMPYVAEADAFVEGANTTNVLCNAALLHAAKKLKWIQWDGAGADGCMDADPSVAAGQYVLTTTAKIRNDNIAEDATVSMLSLMRGIDLFARQNVDGHAGTEGFGERGWKINGRVLLVVGLGGIGTDIAEKAHAFGMRVIGTRASSHDGPPFVEYVGLADELPKLIGRADVVVMSAPLTPETKGLFNAAMFARMKKGAIFVSAARGQEVVQPDLIAALKSGQVGAAALRVHTPEPLPDHDPLYSAPNILIIPRSGAPKNVPTGEADTDNENESAWLVYRENMRRYAAGEKMLDVVDFKRGY